MSIVVGAAAWIFEIRPFLEVFHSWVFAAISALAGLTILGLGIACITARPQRAFGAFAAVGAFGGALLAGSMVLAAFIVGTPRAIPGVPGQLYPVGAGATISYPDVALADLRAGTGPNEVDILSGARKESLRAGNSLRLGAYVFVATQGPIAFVEARSPRGQPVTITQPNAATFVSPWVLFPIVRGAQRVDTFATPALHRTIEAAYYEGLPERGITTPFVLLQVAEENGGVVSKGVTVSGRPFRAKGVTLTFTLGSYPIVTVTSAPPIPLLYAGLFMLAFGLVGYCVAYLRRSPPPNRVAQANGL